jgi:uncharacterized protein YndB with AHSA1/START domain
MLKVLPKHVKNYCTCSSKSYLATCQKIDQMEKEIFTIEFPINSSKGVLYNCMSTPSGLAEWFCDDVNIKKDVHTFIWDGSEEVARMITKKKDEFVKFKWMEAEEDGENTYFELRIKVDDMTGDRAIIITDFADADEVEGAIELWTAQLENLKRVLGG